MSDAPDDTARLARVKTTMMDPEGKLEPHDIAWLFRLADEAIHERQRMHNHTGDAAK